MKNFYHSSFNSGIAFFNPCSHFGTESQAIICAAAKFGFDNFDEFKLDDALIYKVTILNFNDDFFPEVSDFGTSNIRGVLLGYGKLFSDENDRMKILRESNARANKLKIDAEDEALNTIKKLSIQYNHAGVKYNNIVEIDQSNSGNNYSYCVFDSNIVTIDSVDKIHPDVMLKEFEKTNYKQFGLGLGAWNKALDKLKNSI